MAYQEMSNNKKYMNTTSRLSILATIILFFATSCGQREQASQDATQTTPPEAHHGGANQEATTHTPAPPVANAPAATIPDFNFYRLNNGMRFERSDLSYKGNIVMVFFDPTCVQCQHEAKDMSDHYDRIEGASLYFVSMNDPALIHAFLPTYASNLADKENVVALYDRDQHFINRIHLPQQYPSTYVYGSDGRLKTFWNGYKDIEEIIAAVNN